MAQQRQMYGSKLSTEDELKSALDEISKIEKDMGLITVIARTLFEKSQDQSQSYTELEDTYSACNVKLDQIERNND
jgi:chaperonin cofactor prefoldin